jgi:hypothetical protein
MGAPSRRGARESVEAFVQRPDSEDQPDDEMIG